MLTFLVDAPDSLGFLIVRIVVETESRFLRWETDDGVHRARRPLDDRCRRIGRQHHAAIFRQKRQDDRRVLLKFAGIDDVVASDVVDRHGYTSLANDV
jgi:hypothetical protein